MRWSIVRLIWFRELRDQLRDRRTIFMIAVLPILLYPLLGLGFVQMVQGYLNKKSIVIVEGADNLPQFTARSTGLGPVHAVAWLSAVTAPPDGGGLAGVERIASAAALSLSDTGSDYPPLFVQNEDRIQVPSLYLESSFDAKYLSFRFEPIQLLPEQTPLATGQRDGAWAFLDRIDKRPLERREADLLLVFPSNFSAELQEERTPPVYVMGRDNDERSTLAMKRMQTILDRWKSALKETRLLRDKRPATYDEMFKIFDPKEAQPPKQQVANVLFDLLAKILPVILIMWSLAGALYPAIDLCAGEKERGTMETLLITPASRNEIVYGKFLTIWVFSASTALLNLASMGVTTWLLMPEEIGQQSVRSVALLWGIVLLLPVSAFFSAVCLAVGAYARSSKEGQYYLMPLFMITLPLIFLTLVPDVSLNPFWSMVPVTGVALLLQSLIAPPKPDEAVWYYFVPVLLPMLFYSWLALRWAIGQFKREEVLFREAERLDIGLWLKQLLREKERLPTAGEAVFCFLLIVLLNRVTLSFGEPQLLVMREVIRYLAFTAAPPLFMALLLTTRPRQGFAFKWPAWWAWPAAPVLAAAITLPCVECIRIVYNAMPTFGSLVDEYRRSVSPATQAGTDLPTIQDWLLFVAFVVVGAVSEEIAFRGFILTGLRQRYRPATAVFLSSFLFALSQMNVFQFVPHFVLGAVLGFLVLRTGSLLPGIVFHLTYNAILIGPYLLPNVFGNLGYADSSISDSPLLRAALAGGGSLVVAALLLAIVRWTRPPAPAAEREPVGEPPHIETAPWGPALAGGPASPQLKAADQAVHKQ
jgi:sodium transport system permease protein